jgi:ankyrin repeat protein
MTLLTTVRRLLAPVCRVGSIQAYTFLADNIARLRSMHYSASLAQLAITGIMTILRTTLRRGLSLEADNSPVPSEQSYSVFKISEGHELDDIAKRIAACKSWHVITYGDGNRIPDARSQIQAVDRAKKVWQARIRLAELSDLGWEGGLQAIIDSFVETIQTVANHIWSPLSGITTSKRPETLSWVIPVRAVSNNGENECVELSMNLKGRYVDDRVRWLAERKEIAAIFGLWIADFKLEYREYAKKKDTIWLVDPTDHENGRILSDWWISRESNRVEISQNVLQEEGRILDCTFPAKSAASELRAEFFGPRIGTQPAFITQTSLPQMCYQYLLSAFVSSAVSDIDQIADVEIKVVNDRRTLSLISDSIRGLAETMQQFGPMNAEDAYRIIVPALARWHKLPYTAEGILKLVRGGEVGKALDDGTEFCRLVQFACIEEINILISRGKWKQAGELCRNLERELPSTAVANAIQGLCRKLVSTSTRATRELRQTSGYPLHDAVRSENMSAAYGAIRKDQNLPAEVDKGGQVPLHIAASVSNISLIKLLLFFGALVDVPDTVKHRTALHFLAAEATSEGDSVENSVKAAELLLQNGADINASDIHGNTALLLAAGKGCEKLVALLVEAGADLNAQNKIGDTAIKRAAERGSDAAVTYFLNLEPKPMLDIPNKDGDTALLAAARNGHVNIARQLKDVGASMDFHTAVERGYGVVFELLDPSGNYDFNTALHLASAKGYENIARLLLEKGVDENVRDESNNTPLILAAENGHEEIVSLLLGKNANVHAVGSDNRTALLAVRGKHESIMRLLIAMGANVNARDQFCLTPLHAAALGGYEGAVKLLLDSGADVNAQSEDFKSPLHSAATSGSEVVMRLLLEAGAAVNVKDVNGDTPLLAVAQVYHEASAAMAELLLGKGADANSVNNDGYTALQWAIENENEPMRDLLLRHGASVS